MGRERDGYDRSEERQSRNRGTDRDEQDRLTKEINNTKDKKEDEQGCIQEINNTEDNKEDEQGRIQEINNTKDNKEDGTSEDTKSSLENELKGIVAQDHIPSTDPGTRSQNSEPVLPIIPERQDEEKM